MSASKTGKTGSIGANRRRRDIPIPNVAAFVVGATANRIRCAMRAVFAGRPAFRLLSRGVGDVEFSMEVENPLPIADNPDLVATLSDGRFISVQATESRREYSLVTFGGDGLPTRFSDFRFEFPYLPVAVAATDSEFLVLTAENRIYSSSSGETWTFVGTADIPFFPTVTIYSGTSNYLTNFGASGRLRKVGAIWLYFVIGNIYRTADITGLTGWTQCELPTDFSTASRDFAVSGIKLFVAGLSRTADEDTFSVMGSIDNALTFTRVADHTNFVYGLHNVGTKMLGLPMTPLGTKGVVSEDGGDSWLEFDYTDGSDIASGNMLVFNDRLFLPLLVVPYVAGSSATRIVSTTDGVVLTEESGLGYLYTPGKDGDTSPLGGIGGGGGDGIAGVGSRQRVLFLFNNPVPGHIARLYMRYYVYDSLGQRKVVHLPDPAPYTVEEGDGIPELRDALVAAAQAAWGGVEGDDFTVTSGPDTSPYIYITTAWRLAYNVYELTAGGTCRGGREPVYGQTYRLRDPTAPRSPMDKGLIWRPMNHIADGESLTLIVGGREFPGVGDTTQEKIDHIMAEVPLQAPDLFTTNIYGPGTLFLRLNPQRLDTVAYTSAFVRYNGVPFYGELMEMMGHKSLGQWDSVSFDFGPAPTSNPSTFMFDDFNGDGEIEFRVPPFPLSSSASWFTSSPNLESIKTENGLLMPVAENAFRERDGSYQIGYTSGEFVDGSDGISGSVEYLRVALPAGLGSAYSSPAPEILVSLSNPLGQSMQMSLSYYVTPTGLGYFGRVAQGTDTFFTGDIPFPQDMDSLGTRVRLYAILSPGVGALPARVKMYINSILAVDHPLSGDYDISSSSFSVYTNASFTWNVDSVGVSSGLDLILLTISSPRGDVYTVPSPDGSVNGLLSGLFGLGLGLEVYMPVGATEVLQIVFPVGDPGWTASVAPIPGRVVTVSASIDGVDLEVTGGGGDPDLVGILPQIDACNLAAIINGYQGLTSDIAGDAFYMDVRDNLYGLTLATSPVLESSQELIDALSLGTSIDIDGATYTYPHLLDLLVEFFNGAVFTSDSILANGQTFNVSITPESLFRSGLQVEDATLPPTGRAHTYLPRLVRLTGTDSTIIRRF